MGEKTLQVKESDELKRYKRLLAAQLKVIQSFGAKLVR